MSSKGKRWSLKTHKDDSPEADARREYFRRYRQGIRTPRAQNPLKPYKDTSPAAERRRRWGREYWQRQKAKLPKPAEPLQRHEWDRT